MTVSQRVLDQAFVSALIGAFGRSSETPSREEVEKKAVQLAAVLDYVGDVNPPIQEAMIAIDTRMGAGTSLVDPDADHDLEWVYKRGDINWVYSNAYEGFLLGEKWQPNMVQSLSDVATKILGHLQDPTSQGSWSRRGLVIGHVQSGKTANYMGVIAKAADAGYKFIIVIAGIHNNLRKQTQERIDEAIIGRSSDPNNRIAVGVGLRPGYPNPATLTNINEDFTGVTADNSGWRLNDFSKPIILVIKKNVRTLKALHRWLKELNTQGEGQISDVPMLLIDDEADNASINTNREDVNPTQTNATIRRILSLFAKSSYVGYTATPFANIFINPDAYDSDARDELFPRDFIYSLDAPTTYFGPDKVFLNADSSRVILKPIEDCEAYLPFSHRKDDVVVDLPPSLYSSLDEFIVARAIRNLRGQSRKHCSMMINVSRFVSIQTVVQSFVSVRERKIREAVKANYLMPEEESSRNVHMARLQEVFWEEYSDSGFEWAAVKNALWSVFEHLRIFVVNSKSDEQPDFKKYGDQGIGLTAITIGGLSLSRGLTIDGLTVSYMYRNTQMYDTLMQMGRWFGYRPAFEDLCRVHLSQDSIDWYAYIANASEELRQQIKRMRRDGLSPIRFGLYVESHPDALKITAANKMRGGEKVVVSQNFTGRLMESTLLSLENSLNESNEALIEEYWRKGFGKKVQEGKKGWFINDVRVDEVQKFLNRFQVHSDYVAQKNAILAYLHAIEDKFSLADVLLISKGLSPSEYRLGTQDRSAKGADQYKWRLNGYRLASRNDESIGLSPIQLEEARLLATEDAESKGSKPSDFHYRVVRNKPLLMLHVLKPVDDAGAYAGLRVPAFGVSFPDGIFGTDVEVVANRVWLAQYGLLIEDLAEDEDYDD